MRAQEEQRAPFKCHFGLREPAGAVLEEGAATLAIEAEWLELRLPGGAPLRLGFADLDALSPSEHAVAIALATGERLQLSMMGSRLREFLEGLRGALANYRTKHLLFDKAADSAEDFPCEAGRAGEWRAGALRIFGTHLAFLPDDAMVEPVPYGELTSVTFDEAHYLLELSGPELALSIGKLGTRTRACAALVEERLGALRRRNADALATLVPGLPPLTARRLAAAVRDGVPVRRAELDAIDLSIWLALEKRAVAEGALGESFDQLSTLALSEEMAFGLKETSLRSDQEPEEAREEEGSGDESEEEGAGETDPMAGRVAFFAFPILSDDRSKPGNAVAFEVASREGRATYLFRIMQNERYGVEPFEVLVREARARIRSVARAMVALGFRREPISLSDEKLRAPKYDRYRLALRCLAPLNIARAMFVGRAIHGAAWRSQLDEALLRARAPKE